MRFHSYHFLPLYCDCDFNFDYYYHYYHSSYRHPGCLCPPLYEGPHCEFLVSKLDIAGRGESQGASSASDDSMSGLAVFAVFIVATFSVLALFVARRVGKKVKRQKEATSVNLQSFRDENFGALSPNGNTLFPAFSMDIVEGARARDAQLYDVEFT
jgi:hypothetical protein